MTHPEISVGAALPQQVREQARRNVRDLVTLALEHDAGRAALLVYDTRSELAAVLADAYRACLPDARRIDFDAVPPQAVLDAFAALAPGDLVVLVQTTNFRLDAYRLRVELFKLGLKVVEHVHLSRMPGPQGIAYIDGLAYDPAYFRGAGAALKARIDTAARAVVDSGGALLTFGPLEPAKLNVGDYRGMANVGGQFPIGEVFTEARDLESVGGQVRIFVFGDTAFLVNRPPAPITLVVERGRVTRAIDATPAFEQVLDQIHAVEGEVWLRELGFGLNRAFTRTRMVDDIGTYERMCGVHLSLGAKHGVYAKPRLKRKDARFHIDVFAAAETVWLDDACVYRDGAWQA